MEASQANLDNPFGHKAELTKKFGFLSMLGIGFVITGYETLSNHAMLTR